MRFTLKQDNGFAWSIMLDKIITINVVLYWTSFTPTSL